MALGSWTGELCPRPRRHGPGYRFQPTKLPEASFGHPHFLTFAPCRVWSDSGRIRRTPLRVAHPSRLYRERGGLPALGIL